MTDLLGLQFTWVGHCVCVDDHVRLPPLTTIFDPGKTLTWQLWDLPYLDGHFVFVCITQEFSKEDMAKSLLHMISNDIGQLACLYAKLHNLTRVYFGGFFIRGHPVTMHTITYSINFFTKVSNRYFLNVHKLCNNISIMIKWLAGKRDPVKRAILTRYFVYLIIVPGNWFLS